MEISVTNPQSLAQEGKWEMRGWVMTILLCSSYWCWSEDTPQSKWRWPTSSSMRSSMPREGLGPPIVTSLSDQLPLFIHSFLPRAPMPPEAGLRQFWHLPSLETQDSCCSSLSAQHCVQPKIIRTFYPQGLFWGHFPVFPCSWALFRDTLAHWEGLSKSREP